MARQTIAEKEKKQKQSDKCIIHPFETNKFNPIFYIMIGVVNFYIYILRVKRLSFDKAKFALLKKNEVRI